MTLKVGGKWDETHYSAMAIQSQIDLYGRDIILMRLPELEDDGEGGVARAGDVPVARPVQHLCFVEAAPIAHVARGSLYQDIIGMGQRISTSYALVGTIDADIKKEDTFTIDEFEYTVKFVIPDHDFMRLGEVERVSHGNG